MQGDLEVRGCEFSQNSAPQGGAIYSNFADALHLADCLFEKNSARYLGGAVYASRPDWAEAYTMTRCSFVGNSSGNYGGAIKASFDRISSCSFVGNVAPVGGGAILLSDSPKVTSCIFWDNRAWEGTIEQQQVWFNIFLPLPAAYSCIQGLDLISGSGNTGDDPLFVDPGRWDDNGTPDDLTDDFFVVGDYHLLPDSPCIDAGDPDYVAEAGVIDFDGEPRVMHCRVDMGVDEFTLPDPLPGDFDGSGVLDMGDVPPFIDALLGPTTSDACIGDLTGDGLLDGRDIAVLVDALLGV